MNTLCTMFKIHRVFLIPFPCIGEQVDLSEVSIHVIGALLKVRKAKLMD